MVDIVLGNVIDFRAVHLQNAELGTTVTPLGIEIDFSSAQL